MKYTVLIGKNLGSAVHTADCRCVANKGRKEGAWSVEGLSAAEVARQWDTDNATEDRKLPPTKVCQCAK